MSFTTFTHRYPEKSNEPIFIDVDPKPTIAVVKEERPPTPEEKTGHAEEKAPEKLQCSECAFSSVSAERMVRHMRKHRGENPFQCSWCDYSTYNSTMYEEHVNIHKGIKPYKCNLCDYRSVSKKYIKQHESRHRKCDKCGFVARNILRLRRHKRENGCGGGDDKTKTEQFACKNCNIFYNTAKSLKEHVRLHRVCPECGEGFSSLILKKHRKKAHGVKKNVALRKYNFKCDICQWQSGCLQKILLHLIHHPSQEVDSSIDVTPLVKAGILT